MSKALKTFPYELSLIQDKEIREFVIRAFDQLVPDYFFERGASRGKYHPVIMNVTPGGLVRHTKYVVWWANEHAEAFSPPNLDYTVEIGKKFTPDNLDEIFAASILHDMMKDGNPALKHLKRSRGVIGGCHGVDCASAIYHSFFAANPQNVSPVYSRILLAIAGHMGRWTLPVEFRPAFIQNPVARHVATIVHTADYSASRRVDQQMRLYEEEEKQKHQTVETGQADQGQADQSRSTVESVSS